ncbi:MAG: ComF family protein [Bacillus sp. (in: Bacteria)]|nr:ComF family protein [Bacillus sp. (in: firmicutes)]
MSQWREMVQGTERCLCCHELFDGEIGWSWMLGLSEKIRLCPLCAKELRVLEETSCQECGRPALKEAQVDKNKILDGLCYDCQRWHREPPWDTKEFRHRSLYEYTPFLQEILATFKYRGDAELATLFAKKLKAAARKIAPFHLVTYIPLTNSRQWVRGFNQAELLAQNFSPVCLLTKSSTNKEKQSKRSREERIAAMKQAFTLSDEAKKLDIQGKNILLVDDIYTTGATLRCAASVLYEGGAAFVGAVTVARAVGSKAKQKQ